jgi:pyridoxamine 5'-phosphate oxidase family protein
MGAFTDSELRFLSEAGLGHLATVDASGLPHLVPLGWSYNPALDTIDIGGRAFDQTRKFRNVQNDPKVAFVVDDVLPPWRPRCVMVRGRAEALTAATDAHGKQIGPIIRVHPVEVISWGTEQRAGSDVDTTITRPMKVNR